MGIYQLLVTSYNNVLSLFPEPVRWLVTLLILAGLVMAFVHLIRANWLWLILLVLLLPVILPILGGLLTDIWTFLLYLLGQAQQQSS